MAMPMSDDSRYSDLRRRRFRPIPVRLLVPNVITLLAICAGLTAIRLSNEGRMELAVAAIVFAALLDGLDGRVEQRVRGHRAGHRRFVGPELVDGDAEPAVGSFGDQRVECPAKR